MNPQIYPLMWNAFKIEHKIIQHARQKTAAFECLLKEFNLQFNNLSDSDWCHILCKVFLHSNELAWFKWSCGARLWHWIKKKKCNRLAQLVGNAGKVSCDGERSDSIILQVHMHTHAVSFDYATYLMQLKWHFFFFISVFTDDNLQQIPLTPGQKYTVRSSIIIIIIFFLISL